MQTNLYTKRFCAARKVVMSYEDEVWADIEDFPRYEVSNAGLIVNSLTGRPVKVSKTQQGDVKVSLIDNQGFRRTVSVKVLVARAFVEGETEVFDTPVLLDGQSINLHESNIVWRPRWFALKYARQFNAFYPYYYDRGVVDNRSKTVYQHVFDASTLNGYLMREILESCHNNRPVFPNFQTFSFV
jgi:hypothetical protein